MWALRAEGTSSKPHGEEVPAEGGDEEEGNKEKINKTKIVLVQCPNVAQLRQMINDHDLHHQLENKIDMPVDTANMENKVKAGLNKKPKKFISFWHAFRTILKLSGRLN